MEMIKGLAKCLAYAAGIILMLAVVYVLTVMMFVM